MTETPLTHSDFLRTLPAETRAALTQRSARAGLWHLAGHGGLILLIGALIAMKVPGWWALLPVQGVLIVFLFTLEHECTHKTPFASDVLCDRVGSVCGALILNPFQWFRYFHLAHHRHTNTPGDPEIAYPKPQTRADWIKHVSGLPLWLASGQLILRLALGRERPAYLPDRARPRAEREARILLAVYALAALSFLWTDLLLWVWIVPILLGQPFLRLYLLAEHGDCPQVADMFLNTRTTFTNAVVRFLAWNMPYHVEHHTFPSVPFDKLPALHRLMRDHLGVTADGYVAFSRAYLARHR
ncbi:fatty acid desaturase [Pararhodobacter sp. CCB-MM2]|uniref:fatty acid desaturase n=1 Tax=Pararhodobacter sp. CCB-MM2 TaxID=1786003 RepID=UPI000A7F8C3F|nr:fatty acid desaturase [Pararhodobacter sp. CCB-MM2]